MRSARLLEEVEITLMLEGLYKLHGFDFRNYAYAYLRKRIRRLCQREDVATVSALQDKVFHDFDCRSRLVETLTITSTSMFRDPAFFQVLRRDVLPIIQEDALLRIWQPGCSTGQDAFSLAIMLDEEGLYDRCRIYATDLNISALKRARAGILPLSAMKQYTENYVQAGGKRAFSEYYTANYDGVKFSPALMKNIVFGHHNLATDGFFNEFHIVLLRNVLVQFNAQLRERVLHLAHESLYHSGILALGKWDTLRASGIEKCYKELDEDQKLYRRYCA